MIESLVKSGELVWFPNLGLGYFDPGQGIQYGRDYYDEYCQRARNEVSATLMEARCQLVDRHLPQGATMVDVGCGAGTFIQHRLRTRNWDTYGYDVNPWSVHWLVERGLYWDVTRDEVPPISLWDVIEHLPDPVELLARTRIVFVSTPIYRDVQHVLASKHFKPGEHLWYFSERGVGWLAKRTGMRVVETNRMEEEVADREDIATFVLAR